MPGWFHQIIQLLRGNVYHHCHRPHIISHWIRPGRIRDAVSTMPAHTTIHPTRDRMFRRNSGMPMHHYRRPPKSSPWTSLRQLGNGPCSVAKLTSTCLPINSTHHIVWCQFGHSSRRYRICCHSTCTRRHCFEPMAICSICATFSHLVPAAPLYPVQLCLQANDNGLISPPQRVDHFNYHYYRRLHTRRYPIRSLGNGHEPPTFLFHCSIHSALDHKTRRCASTRHDHNRHKPIGSNMHQLIILFLFCLLNGNYQ